MKCCGVISHGATRELSVFTLWALTVYLAARKKMYIVTLLPALFMTCVTTTYIFFAPEGFSAITTEPVGSAHSL